jgi:O-Antigen ligase/Tetratricopeptide repeat
LSKITAVAALVVVVVGGAIFVERRGGPIDFLDQRISEFERGGNPNLQGQGARFGVNVGTNRGDFWRVSLDQGEDHPLGGGGAGSFAGAYLQERDSSEAPNDPHSVEMLMFSELGIVGLGLFGTFVVGSALGGFRTWRLGASAAALAAGSLSSAAYWLAHSSYDWFWHYPAITAPAMFLLGAAAAPTLLDPSAGPAWRARRVSAALAGLAIVVALPLFLSQRYADRAYDEYPGDPEAALSNLDRAADLNPFDPQPVLGRGAIESDLGNDEEAISAFREAVDRAPDSYAGHFFLARALAETDRPAAREEAEEALRLNPLDRQVRRLVASLRAPSDQENPQN